MPAPLLAHVRQTGFALALLAGAMLLPSPARAYRTIAEDLSISGRAELTYEPIDIVLSGDAPPTGLAPEDVRRAVEVATAAWTVDCSSSRFVVAPESGGPASEGDGRTTVATIHSGWLERGYRADQAAITEVRLVSLPSGWVITDADILLNGETIDWTAIDAPEIETVIVHELGHVLGLAHPCEHEPEGTGAPACESSADLAAASVMFPTYQSAAHVVRSDDIEGLCALRPACPAVSCPTGASCEEGACVFSCIPGEPCEGGTCGVGAGAEGVCIREGTVGAACESGDQCASRLCLTSMRLGSFCTRACGDDADCVAGQSCVDVEGTSVCAPAPAVTGCSVMRARASRSGVGSAFIVLVCLAWVRTARRGLS